MRRLLVIGVAAAIVIFSLFILSIVPLPQPSFTPTISQGVYGRVKLYEGNCMPGAGGCRTSAVSRAVYIHEPVLPGEINDSVAWPEGPRLKLGSNATVVKQVMSDANGFYEAELPAGTYSVFVDDNGSEYCNLFDNYACGVVVGDGLTSYNISIDHAAW